MTYLGWKTIFIGLVNEVGEVGRVLTQKPYLSHHVRVINAILNQGTSLSLPQTVVAHFSCIKCVYLPKQV